jgi:hypothetical protein
LWFGDVPGGAGPISLSYVAGGSVRHEALPC